MVRSEVKQTETGIMVPPEDRAPLTFFEGIDFKLRAKGASAGDHTIRQRISELSADINRRGDFFSAHAKEYLRCFQPVRGVQFTNTREVPTLLDQVEPALKGLSEAQEREVLEYLVHDTTKSLVEKKQPRPATTRRSDITETTRGIASEYVGKLEDIITERLEPTPVAGKTQFDRFIKMPVRLGESAGLIWLGLRLGACTPIKTVTPDIIPTPIIRTVPAIETPSPIVPKFTETPSPTPKPVWLTTMETQDPKDTSFKIVDGQPVITVYDANNTATSVVLNLESIHIQPTPDSRYPNVLAANAEDDPGKYFLFNPDRGAWFPVFFGLAPSLEQFTWVDKSDIPIIKAYLRSEPWLLAPDAPSVSAGKRYTAPTGWGNFFLHCPEGSIAVGASIQTHDGPGTPDIVIWVVMTKQGPGFLSVTIFDSTWMVDSFLSDYDRIASQESHHGGNLWMVTGLDNSATAQFVYWGYLFDQPGYLDTIDKFIATGIISPELESLIIPEGN